MTRAFVVLIIATCLIFQAASGDASPRCSASLEFTSEATIGRWVRCHGTLPQDFASDTERLSVALLVNGDPVDLRWRRIDGAGAGAAFKADVPGVIELLRRYEPVNGHAVRDTLSVRNVAGDALSVEVRLHAGGALDGARVARSTLADFVYGFARVQVEAASGSWEPATEGQRATRFAMTSRHRALVLEGAQPFVLKHAANSADEWLFAWDMGSLSPGVSARIRHQVSALPTTAAALAEAGYGGLMYADLWPPLAILSRGIERVLTGLSALVWGPAMAIILLAALIRLLTLPISLWAARRQREFAEVEKYIKPQIAQVKADFRGAEQSERILAIYRENNLSPFSGLKGSVGLFVQIPFLLAVFNVTTASAIFAGETFLWIGDLSLPDTLAALPVAVPLLGSQLNALPIALGVVNVFSLRRQRAEGSPSSSGVTAGVVTLLIVVLFYSFAAAVVLYWLTVNLLQSGERVLLRHIDGVRKGKKNEHAQATA